jgi:hypothetical protein
VFGPVGSVDFDALRRAVVDGVDPAPGNPLVWEVEEAARRYGTHVAGFGRSPIGPNSVRVLLTYKPGGPGHVDVNVEGSLGDAAGLHGIWSTLVDRAFQLATKAGTTNVATLSTSLLINLLLGEIAAASGVDPKTAADLTRDLTTLLDHKASGTDTTAALTDIGSKLVPIIAKRTNNPTIIDVASLASTFPSQLANLERGDALVVGHPTVHGWPCDLFLARRGMQAATGAGLG